MTRVFVDRFTAGLDDLSIKRQRSHYEVAKVLARTGRFSVFEATANNVIAKTVMALEDNGWFEFEPQGFPWTKATITDAGRLVLGIEAKP